MSKLPESFLQSFQNFPLSVQSVLYLEQSKTKQIKENWAEAVLPKNA